MDQAEANLTRARTTHAMLAQHLHELEMQAALFDRLPLNLVRHIDQTRRHVRDLADQIKALELAGSQLSSASQLCQRLALRLGDLQNRVAELERQTITRDPSEGSAQLAVEIEAVRAEIASIQRQIEQMRGED